MEVPRGAFSEKGRHCLMPRRRDGVLVQIIGDGCDGVYEWLRKRNVLTVAAGAVTCGPLCVQIDMSVKPTLHCTDHIT